MGRNQITLWGPEGEILDYATRNGLALSVITIIPGGSCFSTNWRIALNLTPRLIILISRMNSRSKLESLSPWIQKCTQQGPLEIPSMLLRYCTLNGDRCTTQRIHFGVPMIITKNLMMSILKC